VAAGLLAVLAIVLHRKKDALLPSTTPPPSVPVEKDKLVTSAWWESSELRKEYERRGYNQFYWSKAERVPERQNKGYEIVYLGDPAASIRYRIINKSGQMLLAKRDA